MGILDWTQTTTYNKPALKYTAVSGITTPSPTAPDTGSDPIIDMLLTTSSHTGRRPSVNQVSGLPLVNGNTSYGGMTIAQTALETNKIHVEGTIDTPTTDVSGHQLPTITVTSGGQRLTWGDFIAICYEGRSGSSWLTQDPLWYRDPYGRRYDNPRIIDFQASLVEAVPGRNTFTLTLVV